MTGVEIAGLVLGVLPVLFATVGAYSKVHDSLHTFKHWSDEVLIVSKQLEVQKRLFFNECRLLLREAVDEEAAKNMVDNRNEYLQRWMSTELDQELQLVLKENFDLCRDIIEATKDVVERMEEEMKKFVVLRNEKRNVRASPRPDPLAAQVCCC